MKKSMNGFTIVELLIVIVVIAILAAISVIAYTGVQDRAYAAKVDVSVDAYAKIFQMYKADQGEYPRPPSYPAAVCLGKPSDYPAAGHYSAGSCLSMYATGYGAMEIYADNAFNTMLQSYISSPPNASLPSVSLDEIPGISTVEARGVTYQVSSSTGIASIAYYKKGSQACSKGQTQNMKKVTSGGETYLDYAQPGDEVFATSCMIALP